MDVLPFKADCKLRAADRRFSEDAKETRLVQLDVSEAESEPTQSQEPLSDIGPRRRRPVDSASFKA